MERVHRRRILVIAVVVFLSACIGAWLGWCRANRPSKAPPHDELVRQAAATEGLDVDLLRALMMVESSGRADAVSRAGARGLMQLVPRTATEVAGKIGVEDFRPDMLFDPGLNLRLGAHYLAAMLKRYDGDESLALAAYNAGPENVKRWCRRAADAPGHEVIEREGFKETRLHVRRVLRLRDAYRDNVTFRR